MQCLRPLSRHVRLASGAVLMLVGVAGCTSYRILRYRTPDARDHTVFPTRAVPKAVAPFEFARLPQLRSDVDTVTVRTADGRREPFKRYMAEYSVLAFLVIRNDTIVYETYRDGYTEHTVHPSFSVAKSILSSLVGIAIGDGKIRSLDDPITNYVSELKSRPAFTGVTVRNLLEMKSGLRYTKLGNGAWSDFRSDEARIYYTNDLLSTIQDAKRESPPGTKWVYKDTDAQLLGWVLSRAVGMSVAAYTEEKLWRRIGTQHDASWSLDHKNGEEKVASGFNATVGDFARFGRLYLNGGAWGSEQVVPASWVAQSVAVDTTRSEPEISVWWKMQHTLYWWHPIQQPAGDFFADGARGQRIYVDPARRTIVVQLANDNRQDFPFRKIVAYLNGKPWDYPESIPALVRLAALRYGADSVRPVFNRLMAEQTRTPEAYVITQHAMYAAGTMVADSAATRAAGIEMLRIAAEQYPGAAEGFVRLSDAYVKAGEREKAIAAIRRARELAPNDPEALKRARALGLQ